MSNDMTKEVISEANTLDAELVNKWLEADQFRDVSIPNDYRSVSMFNRGIYTIDDDGVISPKYRKVNLLIKTIDDLTLYDQKTCGLRIGANTYVGLMPLPKDLNCSLSGGNVCVIGIISEEFLANNNLHEFASPVLNLSEFNVQSLEQAEIDINDFQVHLDGFNRRCGKNFVRKLDVFREMD